MAHMVAKRDCHESIVFQKSIRSSCVAPIKSKGKSTKDSVRNRKLAEPLIASAVRQWINNVPSITPQMFEIGQSFETGKTRWYSNGMVLKSWL